MSYGPIAKINPQYEDYPNWWLKAYVQGTTTPISMATDSTGATLVAKAELNLDGFINTAGDTLFIPYLDQAYDLWLFPTEAEADANDTTNAIRMANNINPVVGEQSDSVYSTVADMAAASPTLSTIITTLGYYSAGDGGGAAYTVESSQVVDEQGDHTLANGLTAILHKESPSDVRKFGGINGFTPDGAISAATTYEQSHTKSVYVADDLDVLSQDPLIPETADIAFTGGGSLNFAVTVDGSARKSVLPVNKFNATQSGTFSPSWDTAPLGNLKTLKAVLVGDSISTYSANMETRGGNFATVLENYLKNNFEGVEFYDRSIGGSTYVDLDGTPSTDLTDDVDWYTNQLDPWLNYIEAIEPDLIVLAFGMNDSLTINLAAVDSVILTKIPTFVRSTGTFLRPSISVCTNLNPSISGDGSSLYENPKWQNYRDISAGYLRNFSLYHNLPMLDFNRKMSIARDGLDPFYGRIGEKEVLTVVDNGGLAEALSSSLSYNVKYKVTYDADELIDGDFNTFFHVRLSPSTGDQLRITKDSGNIRIVLFGRGFGGQPDIFYDITTTSTPHGAGTQTLCIEKYGNMFTVYRDTVGSGQYTDPVHTGKHRALGGSFEPRVLGFNATVLEAATVWLDDPYTCTPTVTDEELWGERGVAIGPWGGSGWNHPSSAMAVHVYEPVLGDIQFSRRDAAAAGEFLQYLGGDVSLVPQEAQTYGSTNYCVRYLPSGVRHAAFAINADMDVRGIRCTYLTKNTGGTDVVFAIYVTRKGVTSLAGLGTVVLDNTVANEVKEFTLAFNQLERLYRGDQITLCRNGDSGSDTYDDWLLTSILAV